MYDVLIKHNVVKMREGVSGKRTESFDEYKKRLDTFQNHTKSDDVFVLNINTLNPQLTEMMNRDKNSFSKEISDSKIKLKEIQNEIAKNSKINEELEQKITKNKPIFSDVEIQKKKIDEELEQRKKELEVLKKRLVEMKNVDVKNNVGDESKSVVEAASQIVATTNKRLQDTIKELEVIRQLLDKERKAHTETKKKLRN